MPQLTPRPVVIFHFLEPIDDDLRHLLSFSDTGRVSCACTEHNTAFCLAMKRHARYTISMDVPEKPDEIGETKRFFLFELDGELYAVSALDVERVMKIPPITPVPNCPPAILGIFHLRGQVVVVLDLVTRMGMPRIKPLTANYLFVVYHHKNRFGIVVDRPKSIVEVPLASVNPPDQLISAHVPSQYIEGVFMYDDVFSIKKKEKQIILGPLGNETSPRPPMVVKRPVLWISVDRALDQADLATLFTANGASQE